MYVTDRVKQSYTRRGDSLKSAIYEVEKKFDINLDWLDYNVKNYRPSDEELQPYGYEEPDPEASISDNDNEYTESEEQQDPQDFYDELTDSEKLSIYIENRENWD